MQKLLQILKVDEPRSGVSRKTGQPYEIHTAQCMTLQESGELDSVCVLRLSKEMRAVGVKPGVYRCHFDIRPSMQDRTLEAVVVGLEPFSLPQSKPAAAPAKA